MPHNVQPKLFELDSSILVDGEPTSEDFGTFKDSLRAPIHNWFRYPAGYSHKLVETFFDRYNLTHQDWVYDPFSGSGTTLLCAQQRGISGYGVEAHSFVHWVAGVKLFQDYDFNTLSVYVQKLLTQAEKPASMIYDLNGIFPELIYKCYHPDDLQALYGLREFVNRIDDLSIRNLLKLALTVTLRNAAAAGTGWPYIAPNKNTGDKPPKGALQIFQMVVRKMTRDLLITIGSRRSSTNIQNVLGDSREQQNLSDEQVSLALTSPPYLNNYDYADRTRLETYFWGITNSWSEITRDFRAKLLVAATTQINRKLYDVETILDKQIETIDPALYGIIQDAVMKLASLRLQKGGKKDYDMMVALYFNGLLKVMSETYRVLKHNGHFCLVLGDSAPYGVHIATDDLIGRLGLASGFRGYEYKEFRTRGSKWKNNPQRHSVPLREGIVVLTK